MKGGTKTPNIAEDLYERISFSAATLLRFSNDFIPQSTEFVLQFGEGIANVEFGY
jgi:hypothetical protein